MRKLTMAALISISTLSFGATAAFANGPEMDRCNAGPPLGAEERSTAAAPHSQSVAGVNLGCLGDKDRRNHDGRDSRRSSRDRDYDRDSRGYNASRSSLAPAVPITTD